MKRLEVTVKVEIHEYTDDYDNPAHVNAIEYGIKNHLKEMAADIQRNFFNEYEEILIRTEVT